VSRDGERCNEDCTLITKLIASFGLGFTKHSSKLKMKDESTETEVYTPMQREEHEQELLLH